MTVHHQSHRERISAELGFEWDLLPAFVEQPTQLADEACEVRLRRVGKSHRGIAKHSQVRKLWAYAVDQDFLSELCDLHELELLYLDKVTATDLTGLKRLPLLRSLSVIGATKAQDLSWVPTHSTLRSFAIENLKCIHDLEALSQLTQLEALSVEGSTWTPMHVDTLEPLSNLSNLQSLFMTNLRVKSQSLQALHCLPNLRALQCGKFFPRQEFLKLSAALPALRCDWFDEDHWNGSA